MRWFWGGACLQQLKLIQCLFSDSDWDLFARSETWSIFKVVTHDDFHFLHFHVLHMMEQKHENLHQILHQKYPHTLRCVCSTFKEITPHFLHVMWSHLEFFHPHCWDTRWRSGRSRCGLMFVSSSLWQEHEGRTSYWIYDISDEIQTNLTLMNSS